MSGVVRLIRIVCGVDCVNVGIVVIRVVVEKVRLVGRKVIFMCGDWLIGLKI